MALDSWQGVQERTRPILRGAQKADVAIVGGGLTGITLAWLLRGKGLDVVVLEARTLCSGASAGCTGKVTSQLGSCYEKGVQFPGREAAAALARYAQAAAAAVLETAFALAVPHTERCSLSAIALQPKDEPVLEALAALEKSIGLPVFRSRDTGDCPIPLQAAWSLADQGLVQPQRYVEALAQQAEAEGVRIYEGSRMLSQREDLVLTPEGVLEADIIVLATGSPAGVKHLPLLASLTQRSALIARLRGLPPFQGSYVQAGPHGLTLRPFAGDALAAKSLGRVGSRELARQAARFRAELHSYLPEGTVVGTWASQDVYSADGLPLAGPLRAEDSRLLIATGYSGWGLAGSRLAAEVLARRILGQSRPEDQCFSPCRRYDRKAQMIVSGLGKPLLAMTGCAFRWTAPICPHMGCRLRFVPATGRWECPCHGSAFSRRGKMVHGPAEADAEVPPRRQD